MNEVKYCPYCRWGAMKQPEGWAVYDSDKRFHHIETDVSNIECFKRSVCPIHDMKLV